MEPTETHQDEPQLLPSGEEAIGSAGNEERETTGEDETSVRMEATGKLQATSEAKTSHKDNPPFPPASADDLKNFSRLPIEMQVKIFDLLLPGPRLIIWDRHGIMEIDASEDGAASEAAEPPEEIEAFPLALQIQGWYRRDALQFRGWTLLEGKTYDQRDWRTYINVNKDTLCLAETLFDHIRNGRLPKNCEKIKHLMIGFVFYEWPTHNDEDDFGGYGVDWGYLRREFPLLEGLVVWTTDQYLYRSSPRPDRPGEENGGVETQEETQVETQEQTSEVNEGDSGDKTDKKNGGEAQEDVEKKAVQKEYYSDDEEFVDYPWWSDAPHDKYFELIGLGDMYGDYKIIRDVSHQQLEWERRKHPEWPLKKGVRWLGGLDLWGDFEEYDHGHY